MTAQIPQRLLPSTMTWRAPVDDDFGGSYGEVQTTMHVRFERHMPHAAGGSVTDYAVYEQPTGTVWVDAVASVGGVPPVGALVSIDGGPELPVRRVSPYETVHGALHHTELEVG